MMQNIAIKPEQVLLFGGGTDYFVCLHGETLSFRVCPKSEAEISEANNALIHIYFR